TRSYLAQCEPVARFGLGATGNALLLRVKFPDGRTREWKNVAANSVLSTIEAP
ncbi:MAG: UnbV, partial [Planctomycetota bacterium]